MIANPSVSAQEASGTTDDISPRF